ncbi:MAG: hypothetical protein K0B09_14660 [Bacteroidales bacterium]|nr:hypothetical protein [Bacteroidales bacterium]
MEVLNDTMSDHQKLGVNTEALIHLEASRKWTLFLSIMGFIFIGIMLLTPFLFFKAFRVADMPMAFPAAIPMFSMIPLFIMVIIYFFPFYYLLQFSRFSKTAIQNKDEASLASGLKYLKLHYQFMGVLVIIGAGIYVLAIIGLMVGGFLMRAL